MKIVLCVLMLMFAGLQYNDPDEIFWIVIYLTPALCAGLAPFRPNPFRATLLAVCACYECFTTSGNQTPEFVEYRGFAEHSRRTVIG